MIHTLTTKTLGKKALTEIKSIIDTVVKFEKFEGSYNIYNLEGTYLGYTKKGNRITNAILVLES